jgi:predicted Zn-dependent protease
MKRIARPFAAACIAALSLTACTKDAKEVTQDYVSDDAISKIQSMGFGTQGIQKLSNGYLVEGDIILTNEQLGTTPNSPNLMIAQEEQYHTFNLVSASKHPTIKIALNNSSAQHDAAFSASLDEAIRRYNAEGLGITFQRVTTGADITVVAFYENSNTLGSAGFPNSTGDPYNQVRMNTYHYSTGTDVTNTNYIATIMAHEVGHCIGFRHTDYMNRRYSCGSGGNEGQSTTGVGAVHIPGTPTKGDPNSWMLACIGSKVNRPFNSNDKVALNYLY